MAKMLAFLIFTLILSSAIDCGECISGYKRVSGGWLKLYTQWLTWKEAVAVCQKDGAVLASPLNEELLKEMRSLIGVCDTQHFIGVSSLFHPERLVSLEGVPWHDMPGRLCNKLDTSSSQCMGMDTNWFMALTYSDLKPFMCYKKQTEDMRVTECGTYDQQYKLQSSTGSCYKVHLEKKTWSEAYATCLDEDAYLLILNDTNEDQVVRTMITAAGENYVFLGIRELELGGPWIDVHGNGIRNIPFYKVYSPDNMDDDYYHVGIWGKEGIWNYYASSAEVRAFVCEKDPNNDKFPMEQ